MTKTTKHALLSGAVFLLSAASSQENEPNTMPNITNPIEQVIKIADAYETGYFETFPEAALFWGKANVPQDKFSQRLYAALQEWEAKQDTWLKALAQIDPSTLVQSPLYTTYLLLKESIENEQAARICKQPLWDVNPLFGWHIELGQIAEHQPVNSPAQRAQALKRWSSVSSTIKDEIQNLKAGIEAGYSAPKAAVTRVIQQLEMMLASTKPEQSVFYVMAKNAQDKKFSQQVSTLIQTEIHPALKTYLEFLKAEYLPKARIEIGLSALPNGQACYLAKIKQNTTLTLDPQTISERGKTHMATLHRTISAIGAQRFNTIEPHVIYQQAKQQSVGQFKSAQDVLDYNLKALAKAEKALPNWFSQIPGAKCTLVPYPIHRAKTGAAGEYHPAHEDQSKPGIFYINTYEPEKISRLDLEATLYHELLPGHHFQVSLAQEDKSQHSVNKYLWNPGFGEGWALYTERLADEMKLYEDNISKLGMLANESLRTARLVVDPGIHAFGWSREQAVDYMKRHTALKPELIEGEVDRYIMMPGQAVSYMLGKQEIDNLRKHAEIQLKDKFDIRAFHAQVLKDGCITLPMLQANVMSWVENSKASNL